MIRTIHGGRAGMIAAGMLLLALSRCPGPGAGNQAADTKALATRDISPKSDAGVCDGGAPRLRREGRHQARSDRVKDDQIGLKALLAGELESYEGGVPGRDRGRCARRRCEDHRVATGWWVPHGVMVRSGIGTMAELKGKAIAVSAPGSFPDMFARVALANLRSPCPR